MVIAASEWRQSSTRLVHGATEQITRDKTTRLDVTETIDPISKDRGQTPLQTRAMAGLEAAARADIQSFIVMDVMTAAAAKEATGARVIHMEVGQPSTAAPKAARAAVARALDTETLGYTLALGIMPLRQRIAQLYRDWYGLDIVPERIVVTSGSSAAFVLSFLSVFDVGTTVALPNPGYPCYRHILTSLGVGHTLLHTGPENRWMPTADEVDRAATAQQLSGLLLASPANPTGTMIESARLADIIAVCKKRGFWFISDEIYHGLTFGMAEDTALRYSDDVIVINSFSKYFSMTGWRIGWMVVPERMVRTVERLAQNLYISPPGVSQVAALGAFDGLDELAANRATYKANRDLLLDALPKLGFDRIVPADGAFYIYADVSAYTNDSLAFAKTMLEETGIAATPGLDFDPERGHQFMRFSFARSTDDMAEAVRRLQDWPRLKRA
jgi:aspartate/methionine/tyrosine aminotransferase